MNYAEFIQNKKIRIYESGFTVDKSNMNNMLFDWQKDIVRWALKKGKAALFEDCGLGKTPQQLEWSKLVCEHTGGNVLILAPLAVSKQTKREGDKFGIKVKVCRSQSDVEPGINITNYEMLQHFDVSSFTGIVLDESSILKNYSGKMRNEIISSFKTTRYKLSCTATPSPNDYMELGNQCEFLDAMTRAEMLATFFVHDGSDTSKWRLKGHAADKFWEWVASWAVVINKPSDLGYDDNGFILPDMKIHEIIVSPEEDQEGQTSFISIIARTLNDRRKARRNSLDLRVDEAAKLVNNSDEQWLVWCDLNDESDNLSDIINGAVEVRGSNSTEHKEKSMMGFAACEIKALVTKPSIAGYGMNWQNCHNIIFVGLSDSYEMLYQAIRRCWRFGQEKTVNAYMIISEQEGAVKANIERKEREYNHMFSEMVKNTQKILSEEVRGTSKLIESYNAQKEMKIPEWIRSEMS